jgi:hypothetical protein
MILDQSERRYRGALHNMRLKIPAVWAYNQRRKSEYGKGRNQSAISRGFSPAPPGWIMPAGVVQPEECGMVRRPMAASPKAAHLKTSLDRKNDEKT